MVTTIAKPIFQLRKNYKQNMDNYHFIEKKN